METKTENKEIKITIGGDGIELDRAMLLEGLEKFRCYNGRFESFAEWFLFEQDYPVIGDDVYYEFEFVENSNTIVIDGKEEYLLLKDSEVEGYLYDYLDCLVDEACQEIPEHLKCYFDGELYRRDLALGGAGAYLATYDGTEIEHGSYNFFRLN